VQGEEQVDEPNAILANLNTVSLVKKELPSYRRGKRKKRRSSRIPLIPIVDQLLNLRASKIQALRFVPLEE
jgi:hypothetical protein